MSRTKHRCPCCGYLTLHERGSFEICPVCYWEDDNPDEVYEAPAPERPQGPNGVPLGQARANFLAFGAAEVKDTPHVRAPRP